MKTLDPGLASHLQNDTTALCTCWRITRTSGEKLGFTDHDRALAGYTATDMDSSLGLAVDNLDAAGALESGRLNEAQLRAGDYDHAEIEIWRVNWQDVSQRDLVRKGHLGQVTYGAGRFTAEVRGLAHLFNQARGRLYQHSCDAELGDSKCGVNLDAAAFRGAGIIASADGSVIVASGIAGFADGWFTRGSIEWVTGANAGHKLRIKRHRNLASSIRLELWQPPPYAAAAGDQLLVRAGCDKLLATCEARFSNSQNFRGFPHMPGNDFVMQVAAIDDPRNNGGKRAS
jgi:uncharacterized phage protein (TIGR02218 family)